MRSGRVVRYAHVLSVFSVLGSWGCQNQDLSSVETDDDARVADVEGAGDKAAVASTISVCADGSGSYTSIGSAIAAAGSGSTIEICPGTYTENLVIGAKTLTLLGTDGAAMTYVDGGAVGPALLARSAANVTAHGLTFTNGKHGKAGGAVRCVSATLALDETVLSNSRSASGGGLGADSCTVTMTGSVVQDNTATAFGGGVYMLNSTASIELSTIDGNKAYEGGGIAASGGSVEIITNTITDNRATTTDEELYNRGSGGGGIWLYGSGPIVDNTIEGNTADLHGGGIYIYYGAGMVSDNNISDNDAGGDGGGLFTHTSTSTITANTVSGNSAGDDGGGMRVYHGGSTISENTVTENVSADGGGGIKCSHAYNQVLNNIVTDNTAGDEGGGLDLDNDSSLISGNLFQGNAAVLGGGLHNDIPNYSVTVSGNEFTENTASEAGGGAAFVTDIYGLSMSQNEFYDNDAPTGGGLYILDSKSVVATAQIFAGNTADTEGGAVYISGTDGSFANATLYGNDAPAGSGLSVVVSAGLRVSNLIVSHNTSGVAVAVDSHGFGSWTYNDVAKNSAGAYTGMTDPTGSNGNLAVSPGYKNAASGNFKLAKTSGCVDVGDPTVFDADGTRADMGAYGGGASSW